MVTSIILAGGRSLRLGSSKVLEVVGGKSLIGRVIERVKLLSTRTLIVTSPGQLTFPVDGEAEVLVDIYPGKGSLGGIYTGLLASLSPRNIVVACDMPFLNVGLLDYMLELSRHFDAVVPRLGEGKVEPLHAIYSKDCLENIKTQLEHNQLQIIRFLDTVRVRYVERAECQKFDPQLLTFFNINYRVDLHQATEFIADSKS